MDIRAIIITTFMQFSTTFATFTFYRKFMRWKISLVQQNDSKNTFKFSLLYRDYDGIF